MNERVFFFFLLFSGRTFLSLLVIPITTAMVVGEESSPRMHSTSGIMCAGEKKCMPITLPGLETTKKGRSKEAGRKRKDSKTRRRQTRAMPHRFVRVITHSLPPSRSLARSFARSRIFNIAPLPTSLELLIRYVHNLHCGNEKTRQRRIYEQLQHNGIKTKT